MTSFRLYKKEKLCSRSAIDALFSRRDIDGVAADSSLAYPLRAVWRSNGRRNRGADFQFLISIPKKRLHHAVDRVTMRRRVREAYRLNRALLPQEACSTDIAFVYVAPGLLPYAVIERSMRKLLKRISDKLIIPASDDQAPDK